MYLLSNNKLYKHEITNYLIMDPEYIFVIYSCKKNLEHSKKMHDFYFSNQELLNDLRMKVLIMYGDKTHSGGPFTLKDDKYLILQTDDDYEHLTLKSLQLFKAIHNLYPSIVGCFKCDDDIMINMNSLIYFVKTFNVNNRFDYTGTACFNKESENNDSHIVQKKIDHAKNIKTPMTLYCGGPLYYLSNKSIACINDADPDKFAHIYYEDLMIGHILNQYKIYPIHSFLYHNNVKCFHDYSYHNTEKKKTLFVRIHGGLGNQLFQVCSGYVTAQKNNMNCLIVNSSCIKTSFTHVDDNNTLLDTVFAKFTTINLEHINLNSIQRYKEPESDCFTYNDKLTFDTDVYLDGYFQNEKYFKEHRESLIQSLKNNQIYKEFVKKINLNFVKNSYFIHVRRGDYLKTNLYTIDRDRYYKLAIDVILKKDKNAFFFIVSDDIDFCQTYLVFANINKSIVDLPAIETLYLMSLCEKGGICANSTFSWWGSYLNENPKKTVIFPGKWINTPWKNDIYYKGSTVIKM